MLSLGKNNSLEGELVVVASAEDYFELLKPRVMSLAIFTAIIGLLLAPGSVHPLLSVFSIIAIGAGAGAAGAINMWYDHDIDSIMDRTKFRPLPSGRVLPEEALSLGVILTLFSVLFLAIASNYMAAFFLLLSILFYVFIYTIWLKRKTSQNIVIGGAAGALPPVIGWYSVSQDFSIFPLILFLIIFLWTPPHFWALSLYRSSDYEKASIPMLPVIKGKQVTRLNILFYSLSLILVAPSLWFLNLLGPIYGISSIVLSLLFIFYAWKVYKNIEGAAPRLFKYSILYLFLIFLIMPIDKFFEMVI